MSERLPSREQALQLLHKSCAANVIRHCETVASLATETAKACREKGLNVDLELVEIGALLHDIGRSKTHTVHHAVIGAEMAKSLGLPGSIVSIIKRHVGGGITASEAKRLGWPKDIYVPKTIEEKIVAYADKLVEGSHRVPIEVTIRKFSKELSPAAVNRILRLHREIMALVGDCKCRK